MSDANKKRTPGVPRYRFEVVSTKRLLIEVTGALDDGLTDLLVRATVDALAVTSEIKHVLVDLRTIEDCSVTARGGLSSLQKLLARRRLRTAWVVSSPRMQGLAKVIILGVGDQSAAVFIGLDQADAWFEQDAGRIEGTGNHLRRPS